MIVLDKSTHEEHLSQPIKTNNEQFKIARTFLRSYSANFIHTTTENDFSFVQTLSDIYLMKAFVPPGAYELETLHSEFRRNIFDGVNAIE